MLPKILQSCSDFLISCDFKKYRVAAGLWLAVLFLGGNFLWGHLLNWDKGPFNYQDWVGVTGPRLTLLRNAIETGQLPLYSATPTTSGNGETDRILAIPDLLFSPQVLLLPWLTNGQFIVFQILLMFSLGFLGLLFFWKAHPFSVLTFTAVFLLFNFNGHIIAHLSIGHMTWSGYFLLPWFVYLMFDLLEGQRSSWLWTLKTALLLFLILLQGSYHQFVWLLFFIGLTGLAAPKYFWVLLRTSALAVTLAAVRLLPEFVFLGQITPNFTAGFPDPLSILSSLIVIQPPGIQDYIAGMGNKIGLWEATAYVGLVGAFFLIYFGFVSYLKNIKTVQASHKLLLPVLGMFFLSLDRVYYYLFTTIKLPIVDGERVVTRIISVSVVFLIFMAALEFQNWLNTPRSSRLPLVITIAFMVIGAVELAQNYFQWPVERVALFFSDAPFLPGLWWINNNVNDSRYILYLVIGLVVSVASLVFLLVMVRHEKSRRALLTKENMTPSP